MTNVVRTRLNRDDPIISCEVPVDWFGISDKESTVHVGTGFFADAVPVPLPHRRLLEAAVAVYMADKCLPRDQSEDGWMREIQLRLPMPAGDVSIADQLAEALRFLTGDWWDITHEGRVAPWMLAHEERASADAVCLFSGGLDSFAGAVKLLEEGRQVVLVGHNETPIASERQRYLASVLRERYPEQVELLQVYLRPASRSRSEDRRAIEPTTRSRSLLFMAGGLSVAGTVGHSMPLYVPENGFIGINVPLTRARTGSASTRTTHPRFMEFLGAICQTLGIRNPVINPFRLATKGEVVQRLVGTAVFRAYARETVSCSHPEEGRWTRGEPMVTPTSRNCGYCYPCLIRRAGLHVAGMDTVHDYRWDAFDSEYVHGPGDAGADLRALIRWLHAPSTLEEFARHGRVGKSARAFHEVIQRGRRELRVWMDSAPADSIIKDRLP